MQPASRLSLFSESIIRKMTRLAIQHGAINLSQGFPDFDAPGPVKEAAIAAIREGVNQYTITWGYPPLREKVAELYTQRLGWLVDADVHKKSLRGLPILNGEGNGSGLCIQPNS